MILENTIPPFSIGNHFWYVTMGQYLDSGEEVSVNTDRYSEKLGPNVDRPPQAGGLHWTPISRNEVSIYRYLRDRVKVFSL